nr:MAG TPA: Primase-pol, Primase, REPLICATION [Caudoviricetes sp.]
MRLSRLIKHWGVARNPAGGDKRPWGISPTSGGWMPLSTTDTRGWMTAAEAWKRAKSLGPSARVGALLTPGCGVTVVDMDEDYDGNQMAMVEWLDSYAETSSSGRGTHIFVRANLAGGVRDAKQDIEVYGQERFIIVTGNVINGWDVVETRQDKIDRLVARLGGLKNTIKPVAAAMGNAASDDACRAALKRVWKQDKVKRLWKGDWQAMGYPSQSEADMALIEALCFASDDDAVVATTFRKSCLGQREKAQTNYVERTIGSVRRSRDVGSKYSEMAQAIAGVAYCDTPAAKAADRAQEIERKMTETDPRDAMIQRLLEQVTALTTQVAELTKQLAEARMPKPDPEPPATTRYTVDDDGVIKELSEVEEADVEVVPGDTTAGFDWDRMFARAAEMAVSGELDALSDDVSEEPPAVEETVAVVETEDVSNAGLPPGLAGQMVSDLANSVRGDVPVDFATGALLAAVSGLTARNFSSPSGDSFGITNHVVLCAPPGSGKNIASVITGLFSDANPACAVAASVVGGRASVAKLRSQIPAGVIHWSEIGTDLARLASDQVGSVGLRQVIQMFDRAPSSPAELTLTQAGAQIPRHYYLSMIADTQPAYLEHLLSSDASGSGLLSRLTVVNWYDGMQMIRGTGGALTETTLSTIRRLANLQDRVAGSEAPAYHRVQMTREAERVMRDHATKRARQAAAWRLSGKQTLADAAARVHARAERLATAVAIINNTMAPQITEDIAAWAIRFVAKHLDLMKQDIAEADKSTSTIISETLHRCMTEATTNPKSEILHGLQPHDLPTENMLPASLVQAIVARNPKLSRIIKKAGQDDRLMISRVLAVMERDFGVIRKIKIGKQGGGLAYLLMSPYNPSLYSV